MTPARAQEIIRKQNQFPYWGNFKRFMTEEEHQTVLQLWDANPNGNSSFASTMYAIAANKEEAVQSGQE